MRLLLFEADPPYQQRSELRRSWRLISLYGVNPLIPTQPGWDSAWLCTGLRARHSLPALNQNKAAQSSSRKTSWDAWGRWGTHRRTLDLHVNGLRPTAWGTEKHWHPDSSLIRAQLPELAEGRRVSEEKGAETGPWGSQAQALCSGSGPQQPSNFGYWFPTGSSLSALSAFKAFPGAGWLTAKASWRCETREDGTLA